MKFWSRWFPPGVRQAALPTDAIDVSAEERPIPLAGRLLVNKLEEDEGFWRLGEIERVLPQSGQRQTIWLLTSDDHMLLAEALVVERRALLHLSSFFPTQAMVETSYPVGKTIQRPDYLAQTAASSVADACALHRQTVAQFSLTHRAPVAIKEVAQVLEWDKIYRERHTRRRRRRG
jgi:hypothetical protein